MKYEVEGYGTYTARTPVGAVRACLREAGVRNASVSKYPGPMMADNHVEVSVKIPGFPDHSGVWVVRKGD